MSKKNLTDKPPTDHKTSASNEQKQRNRDLESTTANSSMTAFNSNESSKQGRSHGAKEKTPDRSRSFSVGRSNQSSLASRRQTDESKRTNSANETNPAQTSHKIDERGGPPSDSNKNSSNKSNRNSNAHITDKSDLNDFQVHGTKYQHASSASSSNNTVCGITKPSNTISNEVEGENLENDQKGNVGSTSCTEEIEQRESEYRTSDQKTNADKTWLKLQYHDNNHQKIKKPDEIQNDIPVPPGEINPEILDRIQGSMIGMALGDALGAHVEFRPRDYLAANPVKDLEGGGTWGLKKGQFTDDTSMALCLANSLIACCNFNPYDQLVRYKWWHQHGYMSSTGQCFDIGAATRNSIVEFERRQGKSAKKFGLKFENMDFLADLEVLEVFNVYCSEDGVAGNGALMRLAPVPLFFYKYPEVAVELSGISGQITHGDRKAYDACRYYGALIVAALHGYRKNKLLDRQFYAKHKQWFGENELHPDIQAIAEGSYQRKGGYDDGIRGKGYIVKALEAALWAFWADENSFEKGALDAVNLGDDADTTAAIYGQLAGAYYGYRNLPKRWLKHVYAKTFMENLSEWLAYEGDEWQPKMLNLIPCRLRSNLSFDETSVTPATEEEDSNKLVSNTQSTVNPSKSVMKAESSKRPNNKSKYSAGANLPKASDADSNKQIPSDVSSFTPRSGNLDPNRCLEWTYKDVCEWIKSLDGIPESYADIFREKNIDGYDLLHSVDKESLQDFGIDNKKHLKLIHDKIEELKERSSSSLLLTIRDTQNLKSQFEGDYVPSLYGTEIRYFNTYSCILQPHKDNNHRTLCQQILNWLRPLKSDIQIDQIELIHNDNLYRTFLEQIKRIEIKQTQPEFQPDLNKEKNPIERKRVLDQLQNLINQVKHNRSAPVVRVWYGCHPSMVEEILSRGFAAVNKQNKGWFGKAMYFTSSAEYAARYINYDGCLIMCYVVLRNPFPVITDDAPPNKPSKSFRFYGKGSHANYGCHYIPVAPTDNPTSWDFRPPPNGVKDTVYDEFAVFHQVDILPQVVIHLKSQFPTSRLHATNQHSQRIFLSKE